MMQTRREFLELSAKLAATGIALGASSCALGQDAHGMTYGVQMFQVRKVAETDLADAFKLVKDAGFDNVELFPIAYHQSPAQLKKLLSDAGLESVSGHFDYTSREMSVEYAHALGLKYLVCPMLPDDLKGSLDGFRKGAVYFNEWGESARKAGIQFVFHNHDYEFKPLDGTTGWTALMDVSDPHLVKLEFDIFWLITAGQDPMAMLKRYRNRAVLFHMKDRSAGGPISYTPDAKAASYCTELGKGTIDWPALLKRAKSQGIRYAFLDQDETKLPLEQSLKESRAYLRTLNIYR
jgi:sugar phosphate isomerase/epimerase